MTSEKTMRRRLVALFLFGLMLFSYPVLSLFNRELVIFGFPLLFLYLFCAWAALIALVAMLSGNAGKGA